MHRRELLALGGLGLAGCLDTSGTSGDDPTGTEPSTPTDVDTTTRTETDMSTETETETPTETTTIGGDAQLSVTVERLQPAVVEMGTPDSLTVTGGEGTQYLYLRIEVTEGSAPARGDLEFRLAGERHGLRPAEQTFGLWRAYNHGDERYDADRGSGWVLFELPETDDASDAALVWPGGEWQPDAELRDRLASPAPSLSVEWSVSETVTPGAEPTIEFTVTNEGAIDGLFVAALNRTGGGSAYMPVAGIRKPIPAGETVSWTVTDTYDVRAPPEEELGDGEPDMEYKLRQLDGRETREVEIVMK
ncbi:COG1361 family protein [Halorhabdus amylolytica]|uniref:hypothetical protein n=1 Tax=Halorhabdus amylolytica TaxID=2559573 RepID=UPI0010AAD55B|nr:hypothetical protein [Halorhabdus amylolytica]